MVRIRSAWIQIELSGWPKTAGLYASARADNHVIARDENNVRKYRFVLGDIGLVNHTRKLALSIEVAASRIELRMRRDCAKPRLLRLDTGQGANWAT